MKTEIERKFLVISDAWRDTADEGRLCEQGYISANPENITVRVRVIGSQGFLTLKGPTKGISRSEMEVEIPVEEATYMLRNFCADRVVSKMRYLFKINGLCWEVDEFLGDNKGLILAEIELETEDQPFEKTGWLGEEVSFDPRYFNAALARNPFANWKV